MLGFLILPYLTVVPAGWLMRGVQRISTGEFVTAIAGLLIGLLMGLLLGLPLSSLPAPYGSGCRSPSRPCSAWACSA